MNLNKGIKNEIARNVVRAMIDKVYDKATLEEMARSGVKAYYELMYQKPEQREAAKLLICDGLLARMNTSCVDDLIHHRPSYEVYQRAGAVWQTLGAMMEKRNYNSFGQRFPLYPMRHSATLLDHYPSGFMLVAVAMNGSREISNRLEESVVEVLKKLDDAAESMIMVLNVIDKAKKDDDLIKALPEISNVVRHVCDKHAASPIAAALPTAVDQARVRNLLGKLDPIEVKSA